MFLFVRRQIGFVELVFIWWPRQYPDSGRLSRQFRMRVDAQSQPDIAVPSQRLGNLGPNARAFEAGDEEVAARIEVGVAAGVVRVGEKSVFSRSSFS